MKKIWSSYRLYLMIALSGMFFGAELVASQVTHSLVLLSDSYHMLYNIMSLMLLVVSYKMSKEGTLKNTFGWARIEVLGMLFNILFLSALYFANCMEALLTLVHASHEVTKPTYPLLLMVFGGLGILLNALCFLLIGGYTHHQDCYLSIEGSDVHFSYVVNDAEERNRVSCMTPIEEDPAPDNSVEASKRSRKLLVLDLTRDAAGCLLVTACSFVIYFSDGALSEYADPFFCIIASFLVIVTVYPFLKESGLILLQTIPSNIDIDAVKKRLLAEIPTILDVHDLHIWKLTNAQVIATSHITVSSPLIYKTISVKVDQFFLKEGVTKATIQPEFWDVTAHDKDEAFHCILPCTKECGEPTCCGINRQNGELRHHHSHGHQHSHSIVSVDDKGQTEVKCLVDTPSDNVSEEADVDCLIPKDLAFLRTLKETIL